MTAASSKRRFRLEISSTLCKECGYCREVREKEVFESSGMFNQAGYLYITPERPELCTAA